MLFESSRVDSTKMPTKGELKDGSLFAVNTAINKHIMTIYTVRTHFFVQCTR